MGAGREDLGSGAGSEEVGAGGRSWGRWGERGRDRGGGWEVEGRIAGAGRE